MHWHFICHSGYKITVSQSKISVALVRPHFRRLSLLEGGGKSLFVRTAFLSVVMLAAPHGVQREESGFMHNNYTATIELYAQSQKTDSPHKVNPRHKEIRKQKEAKCRQDSISKECKKKMM